LFIHIYDRLHVLIYSTEFMHAGNGTDALHTRHLGIHPPHK